MGLSFQCHTLSSRVIFGAGSLDELAPEIERLALRRALVLCSPGQRSLGKSITERLGPRAAGLYHGVQMHVPQEIVQAAGRYATELSADCTVCVGGGSAIGLGKAIALEAGLPIVAIPTTYAGSEMTPIFGITDAAGKRTGTQERVLPKLVVYDPTLTLELPTDISMTSAMNAIAHGAEGLYAADANPLASLLAEEGIRALVEAMPLIHADGHNLQARTHALYGAWLCGSVLGQVGMALHHKLCHTLGGSFNLPHAPTHSIVLPHALAYNYGAAPSAMQRLANAVRCEQAPVALFDLARAVGAPKSLRQLGLSETDLDRAADIALSKPYWNPRPLEQRGVRELLQRAFEGQPPKLE